MKVGVKNGCGCELETSHRVHNNKFWLSPSVVTHSEQATRDTD